MVHTDSMHVKTRKTEQSEATQAALLAAGRALFTEHGFAATSTEQIVQHARVTRGALYHHFRDKADLFAAVFEELSREISREVRKASMAGGKRGTWGHLVAGCNAFLDACLRPEVRQIVLLDAPAALGWERWRELDPRCGFALMRMGLEVAMEAKLIAPQPIEPLAHILVGALNEAALAMVRAEDPKAARAEIGVSVERLLDGLRADRSGG